MEMLGLGHSTGNTFFPKSTTGFKEGRFIVSYTLTIEKIIWVGTEVGF